MGSHHLLVVWVERLLDQRELLRAQLSVRVDELGKLDTHKQVKALFVFIVINQVAEHTCNE